jgi:hypothetical protein
MWIVLPDKWAVQMQTVLNASLISSRSPSSPWRWEQYWSPKRQQYNNISRQCYCPETWSTSVYNIFRFTVLHAWKGRQYILRERCVGSRYESSRRNIITAFIKQPTKLDPSYSVILRGVTHTSHTLYIHRRHKYFVIWTPNILKLCPYTTNYRLLSKGFNYIKFNKSPNRHTFVYTYSTSKIIQF